MIVMSVDANQNYVATRFWRSTPLVAALDICQTLAISMFVAVFLKLIFS